MNRKRKLPRSFYLQDDVVSISRALLGKILCTNIDGKRTSVIITETEAYAGTTDRASHAYGDRRTRRTEPMYGPGGTAYVTMLERRQKASHDRTLLAGPGSLARALGITAALTGSSLLNGPIRIEDHGLEVDDDRVTVGPRVGIDYAGEDVSRPYRFRLRTKTGP